MFTYFPRCFRHLHVFPINPHSLPFKEYFYNTTFQPFLGFSLKTKLPSNRKMCVMHRPHISQCGRWWWAQLPGLLYSCPSHLPKNISHLPDIQWTLNTFKITRQRRMWMWDGQMGLGMDGSPWVGSGIEHFMVLIRLVPNKLHLHKLSTSISYEQSMFNFITFANFFWKMKCMWTTYQNWHRSSFSWIMFSKSLNPSRHPTWHLFCVLKSKWKLIFLSSRTIVNNVNLIRYSEVLLLQQNGKWDPSIMFLIKLKRAKEWELYLKDPTCWWRRL